MWGKRCPFMNQQKKLNKRLPGLTKSPTDSVQRRIGLFFDELVSWPVPACYHFGSMCMLLAFQYKRSTMHVGNTPHHREEHIWMWFRSPCALNHGALKALRAEVLWALTRKKSINGRRKYGKEGEGSSSWMDEHTNNEQTHSDDHMSLGEYLTEHGQFNSRSVTNQSTLLKFRRITHTQSWN